MGIGPSKESSVISSDATSKKCLAQANLPGSLKPCAETLACEDVDVQLVRKCFDMMHMFVNWLMQSAYLCTKT